MTPVLVTVLTTAFPAPVLVVALTVTRRKLAPVTAHAPGYCQSRRHWQCTPSGEKTRDYNTPLAAFKTSSGIGLGSTLKQLRHAYPHATHPATDPGLYKLKGPGESYTLFGVTDGRISQIALQAMNLG